MPDAVGILRAMLRPSRNVARVAHPSAMLEGWRTLNIEELISPTRYDIIIRQSFFKFVEENRHLCRSDWPSFLEKSKSHPYYHWFRTVYCPRHDRLAMLSRKRLERSYARKVRKAVDLFESFSANGFVPTSRISLKSGRSILPTRSGKTFHQKIFPGDGCHRLALLLYSGVTELEPDWYRVDVFNEYRPPDHTFDLLPHLHLPERQYARFLSASFGGRFGLVADLRDWVANHHPSRLKELTAIVTIDRTSASLVH